MTKGKDLKDNIFRECGCCGMFHPIDFEDDCRDDNNRFSLWDIEKLFPNTTYEIYSLEAQAEEESRGE